MKISTIECSQHSRLFATLNDHSAHAYRFLKFGPARRCPKRTSMADYFWNRPPTVEEQTLTELRMIRRLLER